MDGHAELRDIPSEYRWQEDKEEMKADEYHGLSYNRVLAKFLSDKEQNYMASTSATILGETMDLVKPLCTKDDVFLLIDPNLTKPYCYNAMSNGLSATSYAHFFHKDPSPRFDYFKPTTLEGDIEYRETRDMVFARAIALARSELMLRGEKMWQRKQLYYHIVYETVLKNKKREDLPSKESVKNGAYKMMICKELNKLFPRRTRLYMHFLKMKIETAGKHGVISKGNCEALDKRRFCIAP
ncbi:hypothetical protein VPH35_072364 [Triticum aestivum]